MLQIFKILICGFLLFFCSCEKKWNYSTNNSKENWGDLREEYKFCKIGFNQSPINIDQSFTTHDLKENFSTNSNFEIRKKDFVNRIEFFSRDYLTRGKKKFFIRYLEFHHPSEHLVKSEKYSLEMQVAFKSEDEQWLILAYFVELDSAENKDLKPLINSLKNPKNDDKINLKNLVNLSDLAFFYDGSFTTPPCQEGVKWYVMKTPISASKNQMNDIIKLAIIKSPNARTAQEFHPEKY